MYYIRFQNLFFDRDRYTKNYFNDDAPINRTIMRHHIDK